MTISIHIERYTQIRQWPHNISTIYLRQFYHIFTAISFNTQKRYIFTFGSYNHFLIELSLVLIRYIVFLYQSVVWFWSRSRETWWSIFSRSNRRDDHQPLYRLWRVVSRPWVVRAAKLPLASYDAGTRYAGATRIVLAFSAPIPYYCLRAFRDRKG